VVVVDAWRTGRSAAGSGLMPFGAELAGLPLSGAAVVAGVGAAALTALYLLRRRVTRVLVPFVSFWLSAGRREGAAQRLGRRLRRWLSLALQLVILGLIVLAATDPRPIGDHQGPGRTMVLLIDRSASMQARDEVGSRLGRARALAREIVDGLRPDDRALIASFAGEVTAATGIDDDRGRLRAAIDAIRPSEEPGDPAGALAFSAAVLRGRTRPTVILIGDGGGGSGGALRDIDLQFLPVGRRRDNLAIVAFSARRLAGDPSSVELGLVVQSFRDVPSEVTLAITAGPERIPVARRFLRLAAGERMVERLSGVALPDARLEADLEGARDDLSLDDRAFAVVPEPLPLRVLAVGGRNLYLEGALLGLAPTVQVKHVAPGAIESTRSRWTSYDAVIFDGVTPNPAPERGRFLYLDPHGPGNPWPDHGTIADPIVTDIVAGHPLIRQLSLMDLNIAVARRLTRGKDDVAIVSAPDAPLLMVSAHPALNRIALAFDPRRSDLPLRSAFPLFLANALGWLADQSTIEALSWPTGRTVRIDVAPRGRAAGESPRARDISVVSPDGSIGSAPLIAGGLTLVLNRVGFFSAIGANGQVIARVAANLASPEESDLAPGAMPGFTQRRAGGRDGGGPSAGDANVGGPAQRREAWSIALLVALALCAGEWLSFHRRLTV
jgi:hypothetical protein